MLLTLYNETMGSGNPSSLVNLLPGGAGVQTAGTTPTPFLPSPRIEQELREVLDITAVGGVPTPAAIGSVLSFYFTSGQIGAALWQIPLLAGGPHLDGQYGIVWKPGSAAAIDNLPVGSGAGAMVVIKGPCQALCVTPTAGGAIAAGTFLCTDGAGNLQPFQPPSAAPTPTVTPIGGSGTAWSYALVAVGANGTYSAIGTAGSTAAGVATLTLAAYNLITWTPVADAIAYLVVRTVGTGTSPAGVIAEVSGSTTSFSDNGQFNTVWPNTTATQPYPTLPAGGTPTVVQVAGAVAGSTTWTYKITAIAPNGVWGAHGTGASVTTGNAILSAANGNKITWTATAGATLYAIERSAAGGTPSSTGFIGFASVAQATTGFVDYGQAATTFTQNLTPNPFPPAGVALARAIGTLAVSTTTPTLVYVFLGIA
jgi:hypothetical protein